MSILRATAKNAAEGLGLYRLARQWNRGRALILMYHGVTTEEDCPDWAQVPLSRFEAQMRYLRENYNVVPLSRLAQMIVAGDVQPFAAAVTFDEGYRSTYELAYPVLQRLGIPATVYLTTGFVTEDRDAVRYIWTDYIAVLLQSAGVPTLDLRPWGLEEYDLSARTRLFKARYRISDYLKSLRSPDKDGVLRVLEERYGGAVQHHRFAVYHPLTWKEVRSMAGEGLIRFGAHTRNHPILSRLDAQHLEEEIIGSREDIRSRLQEPVDDFAFPSGRREDIGEAALAIVRREFRTAATTVCRLNAPGQDLHLLCRVGIGSDLLLPRFKSLASGLYSLGK